MTVHHTSWEWFIQLSLPVDFTLLHGAYSTYVWIHSYIAFYLILLHNYLVFIPLLSGIFHWHHLNEMKNTVNKFSRIKIVPYRKLYLIYSWFLFFACFTVSVCVQFFFIL